VQEKEWLRDYPKGSPVMIHDTFDNHQGTNSPNILRLTILRDMNRTVYQGSLQKSKCQARCRRGVHRNQIRTVRKGLSELR
jgi:hypothetical protein